MVNTDNSHNASRKTRGTRGDIANKHITEPRKETGAELGLSRDMYEEKIGDMQHGRKLDGHATGASSTVTLQRCECSTQLKFEKRARLFLSHQKSGN